MSLSFGLLLFAASLGAGAMKAIAGGGTFLIFPLLVIAGVDPAASAATCIVSLWPGDIASVAAYRKELHSLRTPLLLHLVVASILGGFTGALLLLSVPRSVFAEVAPYLLLLATVIFTVGSRALAWLRGIEVTAEPTPRAWLVSSCQFFLSVYGGLFGAGLGILMLALFSLLGMNSIHRMNALKNLLGTILNGLSAAIFLATGAVSWEYAVLMMAATALGGYSAASIAQRIDPGRVRLSAVVLSWAMTTYYFARHFGAL